MNKKRTQFKPGILFLVCVYIVSTGSYGHNAQNQAQQMQILSPVDGAIVEPGQIVAINIEPPKGETIQLVVVTGELGFSEVATASPFICHLTIPLSAHPGKYRIVALGGDGHKQFKSNAITLDLEKSGPIRTLRVEPTREKFAYAGSSSPLRVTALFADGSTLDVEQSANVRYTSANPSVATIDNNGNVIAVGPGSTVVNVSYQGIVSSIPVFVAQTKPGDLNADGVLNSEDMSILKGWIGHPVSGPFDARDLNHDGRIDQKDVELMKQLIAEQNTTHKEDDEDKNKKGSNK